MRPNFILSVGLSLLLTGRAFAAAVDPALQEQRRGLKMQLVQAERAGDHEKAAQLRAQLKAVCQKLTVIYKMNEMKKL